MKKYLIAIVFAVIGRWLVAQTVLPPSGQSTYVINSGQSITVTDGQSITFGPGVHIKSGASFTATIVEATTANDPYAAVSLSDENYVFTRNFQKAMSSFTTSGTKEGDVYESITYFDGLGRGMQQVNIKGAPDKEDLVTHMEYDDYGRMAKEWLPYHEPSGTLGTYRGNKASATRTYYKANYADDFTGLSNSTANAYSEKEFEPSPLDRVLKQAAPGKDWKLGNGHEIEFDYKVNAANEVRLFTVNLTTSNGIYVPSLANNGYYPAGELYKTITYDENHSSGTNHSVEEFVDKRGRTVLKRTHNNGDHDTYYVYDDHGNLSYVIPPKVTTGTVSTTELNELCYQYRYDHRNRLAEKKLPGKDWEYIVYNKLNQPIMTQDANLRANNQWLFTKYDAFGRVVYTGRDDNTSATRVAAQNAANNASHTYESRRSTSLNLAGTPMYYTNNAYLNSFNKVFTINYYDSYVDTDGLTVPSTVLGQATTTDVKGLSTVSKVRVLDTDDWITTITGYDTKGRAIYTASKNDYLSTTDIVETELDFAGKVIRTKSTHTKTGNAAIVTEDTFTYDHAGRLLVQNQTINGQNEEKLVSNSYDNIGQLVTKEVGGGLQTVDYGYNVRGWLKNINNTASLGNDLFAFAINYNTEDHNATKLYNGNISETEWRTASTDNGLKWYRYGYDALNRIESATANSSNYNLVNVDYDKNGNITALNRRGHTNNGATSFGTMDNLVYGYHSGGNRLRNVADSANDNYGFKDTNGSGTEYQYDDNGNMTSDTNRGISNIEYNHLNLPTRVTISNSQHNGSIDYVYDALGTKLKKLVSDGTETEYCGAYVYEGNTLQFFPQPEGYVTPDGSGSYDYVYNCLDHLKNVRLSYTDADGNGSIEHANEIVKESNYYPFGLAHKGYNNIVSSLGNSVAKRYMFGGKEYQEELGLGWYDITVRNYDPTLGRWMNLDPLSEDMRRHSPYTFAFNSPIYYMDYDGMAPNGPGDPPGWWGKIKSVARGVVHGFIDHDPNKPLGDQSYTLDTFRTHTNTERVKSDDDYYEGGRTAGKVIFEAVDYITSGGSAPARKGIKEGVEKIIKEGGEELAEQASKKVNWKGFSKGKLKDHFEKHGDEFGDITQTEYLKQAKEFAKETGETIQEKTVGNLVVKYDSSTKKVLVGNSKNREIRTFYKADGRSETPFEDAIKLAEELSKK